MVVLQHFQPVIGTVAYFLTRPFLCHIEFRSQRRAGRDHLTKGIFHAGSFNFSVQLQGNRHIINNTFIVKTLNGIDSSLFSGKGIILSDRSGRNPKRRILMGLINAFCQFAYGIKFKK